MTYDDFCASIADMLRAIGVTDPDSRIDDNTDELVRCWHEGYAPDEAANEIFSVNIEEAA